MIVFGDRAFKEVLKVKWGHKVGPSSQSVWYLTRKGGDTRPSSLSTIWGYNHLWARKRAFIRYQLCWLCDLGLPVFRSMREHISIVKYTDYDILLYDMNGVILSIMSGQGNLVFACSHLSWLFVTFNRS